ncbi:WD40-repeat-containing domain protein [Cyathus striatus]|nr:WD40-repeat-containing domain protein [Cyathus striatus]
MLKELKFNIYNFPSSHTRNQEALPVLNSVHNCLVYSCIYWGAHILNTNFKICEKIIENLKTFLYEKVLYWMEIMSINRVMDLVVETMGNMADKIKDIDNILSSDLNDTAIIVSKFFTPISESVPHIYVSLLPFAPQYSYLRKYLNFNKMSLQVHTGLQNNTDPLLKIMKGHNNSVSSVAFSPDGKLVVSGSVDKTIKIWDVHTGQVIAGPLQGHTDGVTSVAFSPNGKKVISGSHDKTIQIWDIKTGMTMISPLKSNTPDITSVAFSQDGKQVLMSSYNETIQIWDEETGKTLTSQFEKNTDWTASSFSPDRECVTKVGVVVKSFGTQRNHRVKWYYNSL